MTEGGAELHTSTSTSCGCSYSDIRMLPAVFSSAFNTISPMKLTVKLHTLGLSTTLPHKQVQESFYWQSRLLQSHVKQWSPSGLCTQPPPRCLMLHAHDCNPRHGENSVAKYDDATAIIDRVSDNNERSTILQSGVHRKSYSSVSAKPKSWLYIF